MADYKYIECRGITDIGATGNYVRAEIEDLDPRIIGEFDECIVLQNINDLDNFLDCVDEDDLIAYVVNRLGKTVID